MLRLSFRSPVEGDVAVDGEMEGSAPRVTLKTGAGLALLPGSRIRVGDGVYSLGGGTGPGDGVRDLPEAATGRSDGRGMEEGCLSSNTGSSVPAGAAGPRIALPTVLSDRLRVPSGVSGGVPVPFQETTFLSDSFSSTRISSAFLLVDRDGLTRPFGDTGEEERELPSWKR